MLDLSAPLGPTYAPHMSDILSRPSGAYKSIRKAMQAANLGTRAACGKDALDPHDPLKPEPTGDHHQPSWVIKCALEFDTKALQHPLGQHDAILRLRCEVLLCGA